MPNQTKERPEKETPNTKLKQVTFSFEVIINGIKCVFEVKAATLAEAFAIADKIIEREKY